MNETNEHSEKELRLKGSQKIMGLLGNFSATEKVIFGLLAVVMAASAIILAARLNGHFLVAVPAQGGELNEGMVGLPRLINPVLAFTDTDRSMSALVYAGLMKYDNGSLVPDLAQGYTVSPDGLTYVFTLKSDLHFQDGTLLTADDVVFTIQAIQNPALKSPLAGDWANISVSEPSPTQVQFVLKQPYAPFLSNTTVGIIPKHIWSNVSTESFIFSEYNVNPVGAGPYKVAGITKDSAGDPASYDLVPWSGYNAGEAYISNIIVHFYPDEKSLIAAYQGGAVEGISGISPDDATALGTTSSSAKGHIVSPVLPHIFGVFFNQNQQPVLADAAVRQALDIGLNKNLIVAEVLDGYGTAIDSPVPAGILAPTSSTSFINQAGSTTAAKAILLKDGWAMGPQGFFQKYSKKTGTTTLAFSISTSDSANLTQTANILKQEWAAIGVQVTVNTYEQGDLNQNVIAPRKYDSLLFGESFGKVPDLYAFWDSSQRNAPGLNIAMYVNASADKLLEAARASSDPNVRLADYTSFNGIVHNDMPAVFLYSPDFIYVIPDDVKGMQDSQSNEVTDASDQWEGVSKWYIDTDSVWKGLVKYAEPQQNQN